MSYLIQSPLEKPNPKSPSNLSSYINTYISSYIDNYLKNDDNCEEKNSHEKSRFNYFDSVEDYSPPTSPQNTEIKDISSNIVKNNKPYSPIEKEEKYRYRSSYNIKNNNTYTRKVSDESRTSTPTLAEEDTYSVANTYKTEEKTLYSTPKLPESERNSISFEDNVNEEYYKDTHHEKIKYNNEDEDDLRYQNQQHEYNYNYHNKYSDLYSDSSNVDDEEDEDYEYTKEYNDNYYKKGNNEYHEDYKEDFRGRKPYRDNYNENGKESFSLTESLNTLDRMSGRGENYNRNSQQSFDSVNTISRIPRTASLNNRLRANSPAGSMISRKSNSNYSSSLSRTNSLRSRPLIISNENPEVQKITKKKSFFKFLKKLTGSSADKTTKPAEINNNKAYVTHSHQSSSSNVLASPTLSHSSSIHSSSIRLSTPLQSSFFSSSSYQALINNQNNFNSTQSIQPSQSSIRFSQDPITSTPVISPPVTSPRLSLKSSPVQSPIASPQLLGDNRISITNDSFSDSFEKINNHIKDNNDTSDNKLLEKVINTDKIVATTTSTTATTTNNNNKNNGSSSNDVNQEIEAVHKNNFKINKISQSNKKSSNNDITSTKSTSTTKQSTPMYPDSSYSSSSSSSTVKASPIPISIDSNNINIINTFSSIRNVNNPITSSSSSPTIHLNSLILVIQLKCTYNKKKYYNGTHSITGKRSSMNPNISLPSANLNVSNASISYLRSARRKSHRMDSNNILPRTPSIILDQFSEYSDSTMSEDHTDYKIFNWNYDNYDDEKAIISSDENSSLNINLIDNKLRDLSISFSDHSQSRSIHDRDYDYDHEYEYEYEYDPYYGNQNHNYNNNNSNSSSILDKSRSSCYSSNSDSRTPKSAYIEEATPSKFYDATTMTNSFSNPYANCKSLYSDLNENSSEYYDSQMNTITTIEASKRYQSYIATDLSDSSNSSDSSDSSNSSDSYNSSNSSKSSKSSKSSSEEE
ncbi:hypothetical protein H8356DRAFT_1053055 [Neocallimastix lanati (nom. inval.)]|uniref:Uncharacterized protein n=1 Tax=Neocallimastix californiae TaxID=1754190 RepID=A0A1Y1ZQL1_9FUNG|nr:hypothetical protein H8356DRAFT_1053055 [Neocallimastix sp. JGI-2020a]ORY12484.1 hypothetical protein LY90DRAFT_677773 [Neocallimastix californiae]|eukprot:ORY12484.1 hypothetical protein LY90DRAFT_677773 [Neocallimastix californiae]